MQYRVIGPRERLPMILLGSFILAVFTALKPARPVVEERPAIIWFLTVEQYTRT
jgi:hypothetical protein